MNHVQVKAFEGLPLWFTQQLGPDAQETLINVLVGVVLVPLVIPWGYVLNHYVKAPGARWGKQGTVSSPMEPSSAPYQATTSSRP